MTATRTPQNNGLNEQKAKALHVRFAFWFFFFFVFLAVPVVTTTGIYQIWGCVEIVGTWRKKIIAFFRKQQHRSCQFYSCNVDTHFIPSDLELSQNSYNGK